MSKRAVPTVRSILWFILVALLVAAPIAAAAPPLPPVLPAQAAAQAPLAPYDPYILEVIAAEGQAPFYVVLRLQADLSGAAALPTKEAKGRYVYHALTTVAAETQGPLLQTLKAEGAVHKPYWIRNMVKVWGDKRLLTEMAARPDVAEIIYEYPAVPDLDAKTSPQPDAVEWNILRVNADDVWNMGIRGEGAVVGDLDTGVQWDHPALKKHYRGCLDPECVTVDHNYNWFDNGMTFVPTDYDNHGTHTMGTIVGDDGGANQIGVAPGAQWMACPGIGSPYIGTFDCFQFFLAPTKLDGSDPLPELAPHVINNSWSSSGTDYHPIIQTLYAAGIFYAKSGGNTGPQCGTTTNPGQWPEVTATAAFGTGDVIASFSSRGPVHIGHDTVLKPDIAAPGVSVRSSVPTNSYALMSGTSMACPHVTGAVALLVSANPALAGHIDVLQKLLKQTAEPKVSAECPPYVDHPNDVWGWGILDVHAAVVAAQAVELGTIEGTVTDGVTGAPVGGAAIAFEDSTAWVLSGQSAGDGTYAKALPADVYDLTTTAYGYLPKADAGVVVEAGTTTIYDITLDPAPVWTVSGQVTETVTGNPLAATISVEGTPVSATTDPATGLYSFQVAQGTYWFEVASPGHGKQSIQLTVDSDLTQDFALDAIWNYPMRTTGDPCDPAVFDWIDATGGTQICLSDDSYTNVSLPAGRTFSFYGSSPYSSLYVGSNGIVTFGTPDSKWSGPIPDPATPNNGIYAFSTDLNPASCAQGWIYWQYVDDRYFVIEYYQVQHYPNGNPETFEIILDLDTGQVVLQYLEVSNPADVAAGVENANGTEATQYAYGDPALLAPGARAEFSPAFGTPPPQGPGWITGTVRDEVTLLPIAGATVTAVASGGGSMSVLTGEDGAYGLELCPDQYTVSATADGYLPSEAVVDLGPAESVTVDFSLLPDSGSVAGWVTDEITLLPIEGALVQAEAGGGDLYTVLTAADGAYSLPLPTGTYTMTATADDYLPSGEVVVSVQPGQTTAQDFSLLPDSGSVAGWVTDEMTLLPIDGALVQAEAGGGDLYTALTGADGAYSLPLPTGTYTMTATADDYLPSDELVVSVQPGQTTAQDFALLPIYHHRVYLPLVTRSHP